MKILCLVDNAVAPFSSFWGEHGLALLIESGEDRLLFDTGASGTVLLHNLELAGVAPESLRALALSHSHPDHTGGLPAILKRTEAIPIYAHPDLLRPRFSRQDNEMRSKGLPMSPEILRQQADLRMSEAPQQILPGIWTTGEILERMELEGRSPHHFIRVGEAWAPDPYRDDLSLILETERGLVLVCGCCHAGLLNTLAQVRETLGRYPVGVIGGTHLVGADSEHLERVTDVLRQIGSPALHLNHCTGQAAFVALARAFDDHLAPFPAGTVVEF